MHTFHPLSALPLALLLVPLTARAEDPSSATDHGAWLDREAQLFEQDAISGGTGLLHTQHALGGAPGQLHIGLVGEFFDAGFLCSTASPCPRPGGGPKLTSDSMSHLGGNLTLSATLTRWLEAYAVTGAYGDADSSNNPPLLQALGDTRLGLKGFLPLSRVFHVGGVAELDLVNGSGSVGIASAGTGARFRALGTADLREMDHALPLRVSLDAGYTLDNTARVISDYEGAIGAPVTRIERFGLGINRVDHIDVNLGAETFLAGGRVRPFVEYSLLFPINRQGYECPVVNASGDQCLANDTVIPSTLTLGSRFYPWKRGFSVLAGLDIGVTGVGNFIEELAPTPPWMLYLGLGWAIDTRERPPVELVQTVEKVVAPAALGRLHGLAHRKDNPAGIADAIVVTEGHPEIQPRASGSDGRFAIPVDPGDYKLTVHARGYRDGLCGGRMGPVPVDVEVDCPLETALVQVTATEITIDKQIQFPVDQANILPESDALMREIADTLIKNPRIKRVEVQGHTDSSGTAEYNLVLSQQRAASVCNWLTAHGVSGDRLVPHGYGEERPLIPNVTKGMKAQNRRVQFIIMEQTAEAP
jgi:outer membrane protein OmpA-like peptidoglycan-associated protein